MNDRMENAVNSLPEDARADAQTQLDDQVKFFKDVQAAPAEQRQDMMRTHFQEMMANMAENANSRRSPARMARMAARVVANRVAAQGAK